MPKKNNSHMATLALSITLLASTAIAPAQAGNLTDLIDSIEVCMKDFFENPNDRLGECTSDTDTKIEVEGFTPAPVSIRPNVEKDCNCRQTYGGGNQNPT